MIIPKKIFLTKGIGRHKEKLTSFELALRDAGIGPFNLVYVSSIFPPYCELISEEEGAKLLHPGQILFCVMSRNQTNEPHRLIASSVGIAIPKDESKYGYLSEHHSFGESETIAGDYAEDLAASMLATTLGITNFDVNESYDEEHEQWRLREEIVLTKNITQTAFGEANLWTTAVTCAVMITE